MTPEERLTKIENALVHSTEIQASMLDRQQQHDEDILELRRVHTSLAVAVAAIHNESAAIHKEFAERHRLTDEKLNALIDTVDRFLKGLRGGNGSNPRL